MKILHGVQGTGQGHISRALVAIADNNIFEFLRDVRRCPEGAGAVI